MTGYVMVSGSKDASRGDAYHALINTLAMLWKEIKDGDKRALRLYERHYSCRHYADGRVRRQFVGPGERIVLLSPRADALFVWRKQRYRKDGQHGVECSVFRNEGVIRSSHLIREAQVLAWRRWAGERLFTFVDPKAVQSTNPGYCFIKAGWRHAGISKRGLVVLSACTQQIASTQQISH
jgi:hypothetical protein